MRDFTFVALTYNHEKYILEHLESIKFLIENYGQKISFEIIIADDASKDNTALLAQKWLNMNAKLFNNSMVLSDGINKGTCKNFTSAITRITSQHCKVTAGDDIYSYENLFEAYHDIDDYHLMSGVPLNLIGNVIQPSRSDLFNLIATDCIYQSVDYSDRLKFISFFNAPNFLHNIKVLKNQTITGFLNLFAVTEDFPFVIKAAEVFKPFKFKLNLKTYVYYRRTPNSTYLIKNVAFTKDKLALFTYLVENEPNAFKRIILRNRRFCFALNNRYLKKLLNISIYFYATLILLNFIKIYSPFLKNKQSTFSHQNHYDLIFKAASLLRTKLAT